MVEIVFWLMISEGSARTPPVFLPKPFATLRECTEAGDAFKASSLDFFERGKFVCLPQSKAATEALP